MNLIALGIETSCDETAVAILKNKEILSHIVYNQHEHKDFGGVVPEIASRAHLQILQKLVPMSIQKANIKFRDIDIFSATCGPGLIGGLLVGSSISKALAIGANKPFYPINHLEGHILSPAFNNKMNFPNLTFLLTGGHTQIYLVSKINKYQLLGETVDDAIGESFDKVAKILGLGYPGGPLVEKFAYQGNKNTFAIPHPLKNKKNLNFSFSGIKTAVNLIVKKEKKINKIFQENVAASFQNKIIEIINDKFDISFNKLKNNNIHIKDVAIVGGVASNKAIRKSLSSKVAEKKCKLISPLKKLCGDNAAMIALTAIENKKNSIPPNLNFKPDPRLKLYITNLL